MSSDGIIEIVFDMILTIFYPFLSITDFIYLRLTENLVPRIIYRFLTSKAQTVVMGRDMNTEMFLSVPTFRQI